MARMIEVDADTLSSIKAYQRLLQIKSQKEALRSMISGMGHLPEDKVFHELLQDPKTPGVS